MSYYLVILLYFITQLFIDATIGFPPVTNEKCEIRLANNPCSRTNMVQPTQMFFYEPDWQTCFAYKDYGCRENKNRHQTFQSCINHCRSATANLCLSPLGKGKPIVQGSSCDLTSCRQDFSCDRTICPQDYQCLQGPFSTECCRASDVDAISKAYSRTCLDGAYAGGVMNGEVFEATFAKNCNELLCDQQQRCVQVAIGFAKCCWTY